MYLLLEGCTNKLYVAVRPRAQQWVVQKKQETPNFRPTSYPSQRISGAAELKGGDVGMLFWFADSASSSGIVT